MGMSRALRTLFASAVVFAFSAVSAGAASAHCSGADVLPKTSHSAAARSATLCLLNAERAKHGLKALHSNADLRRASLSHSRDMVKRRYFDHDTLAGVDVVGRLRKVHYLASASSWMVGENIAWGQQKLGTPREIVRAWMHSPGHRANILSRGYREIGVGIATGTPQGGHGATYTTDFGRRG